MSKMNFNAHLVTKFSSSQIHRWGGNLLETKIKIFLHGENSQTLSGGLNVFLFLGPIFWRKKQKTAALSFYRFFFCFFFYFDNAVPGIFSLKICFLAHISLTWSFCACVCVHVIKRKGGKELERLKASTPDWSNPGSSSSIPP